MSRLIRGRLAFAAIGCGIIRLARVVGSPAPMSTVLAGFGVAELGWGVLTLDKLVAPELARMASLAPVIVWAVLVVMATVFKAPAVVSSLAFIPMAVTTLFDLFIADALNVLLGRAGSGGASGHDGH